MSLTPRPGPPTPNGYALSCVCEGSRAERMAWWVVLAFRCNFSAFNGYRRTPSAYSEVKCERCGWRWRTKARYVDDLRRSREA